jgi:hypothetical protein
MVIGVDVHGLDFQQKVFLGGHYLGFQQIQGGQQIGILDLYTFGKRNSWSTGAIAGLSFILHEFNLLASLNLLEKTF